MSEAVGHLLHNQQVLVNERTKHGSSPLMVAVKYGMKEVTEIMLKDSRVDLGVADSNGRTLYEVIGVATEICEVSVKLQIAEIIKTENNRRTLRRKKKGVMEGIDKLYISKC